MCCAYAASAPWVSPRQHQVIGDGAPGIGQIRLQRDRTPQGGQGRFGLPGVAQSQSPLVVPGRPIRL